MNTRLFLAGTLVTLAGINSPFDNAWVVIAFGIAMVVAGIGRPAFDGRSAPPQPRPTLPSTPTPKRERIVRERWRESRERYWPFDDKAA